jgi:hypothetical protein
MKFIVAVDCEGVACAVGSPGASINESRNLLFAQQQATREANAAPLIFEIRFKRLEAAQATSRNASGWVRVDAYTVRRTLTSILDYF